MTTTFIAKVAKNSYRILTGPDSSWRLGTSLALDPSRHGNPLLNQVAHQSPHISDSKRSRIRGGDPRSQLDFKKLQAAREKTQETPGHPWAKHQISGWGPRWRSIYLDN